jgi:hypothetical protein
MPIVNNAHKFARIPQFTFPIQRSNKTHPSSKARQIAGQLALELTCKENTHQMTSFRHKKKPELQALAAELNIDTDGNKADLESRILSYLSEHVNLKENPKFSKYFAAITGPESPGPAGTVGAGRRRSIAAKKVSDLGDSMSKALTRYCLHSCRTDVSVMRRPSQAQKLSRRPRGLQIRRSSRPRARPAISWQQCPAPFRALRVCRIRSSLRLHTLYVAHAALLPLCNFTKSLDESLSSGKQLAMLFPSTASSAPRSFYCSWPSSSHEPILYFTLHCLSNISYTFLSSPPRHLCILSMASLCSFPISSNSFLSMNSGNHSFPGDGSHSLFPSHSRMRSTFPRPHQREAAVVTKSSRADLSIPSPSPSRRPSSYSLSSTVHVQSSPPMP